MADRDESPEVTVADNWTWRTSGTDAHKHAFAAEGGFIVTHTVSVLLHSDCGDCYVHQAEVYRPLCGREIPTAALMPHEQGDGCPMCARVTTTPCDIAA